MPCTEAYREHIMYEKWATLHNLKQMAATMSVYEESGFSSPEELEAALAAASAELSNVHAELKAVESTLREKKDLQKQLLAYIKTKPARDGLRAQKTEKARRAYREQHESDFIIAESAARYFKAQGITKLPSSKTLQAEIEQLTKAKNALYNEYREKKENVRELQTVKSNLDKIKLTTMSSMTGSLTPQCRTVLALYELPDIAFRTS